MFDDPEMFGAYFFMYVHRLKRLNLSSIYYIFKPILLRRGKQILKLLAADNA